MSNVTSTIVKVPKKDYMAFGGDAVIREKWGENIDVENLETLKMYGADELVTFTVFNTRDDRLTDLIVEAFPDCMMVVEDRGNGSYGGWTCRGGKRVFEYSDGYDDEDDTDEDVMDAAEDRVWEKLQEAWDSPKDRIVIDLPVDQYLDDIRKKGGINTIAKAIKYSNDPSSDIYISIACMKFVADTGKKNDINKLLRFYVEETDAGIPEPQSAEFLIINKGIDVIYNEIPGNVYMVNERDVDGFTPKGMKPDTICIECDKEYLLTNNVCKRRRSHINAPSWLNIKDRPLDILCVESTKFISGGIGGWTICKKIICNGKEWPYFIVGRDRRGDKWAPYGAMILCAEDPRSAPIDADFFIYSWWDGSGDRMEFVRLMRECQDNDMNRLLNQYELKNILKGFIPIDGIDEDNINNIKSFVVDNGRAIITLDNGETIDIGIKYK